LYPAFEIENDDKFKTLKWNSLFKDAAFYFDAPTIAEEREMRFDL